MANGYRRGAAAIAAIALLAVPAAWGQGGGPAARIKQVDQQILVSADGRYQTTTHFAVQILSGAAVAQVSQLPVTYNATMEEAEITDAYTQKADGRRIPVDPGNILTQKPPGDAAMAPIYSDAEQKVIIYPNVATGDTLVYTSRISQKQALIPGQFTLQHIFGTEIEADETHYTVSVPAAMTLAVEAQDMAQEDSTANGMKTYRWTFSNPAARPRPAGLVADPQALPHFSVSSFPDYDALAHGLAALMLPKIAVSDAVQSQADSITAGIAGRRAQAEAIYDWVGRHVRNVGIELGVGGIVPHDADWTLTNAFGDCKDQAVLLASLLKAKGIAAELVLLNNRNLYTLSPVPIAGQFNHVIAWLPEFGLYADTTQPNVPFGLLPLGDYGKPVLHMVASGPARHATPLIGADAPTSTYKVHAVMNSARQFDVDVAMTATGPWSSALRTLGAALQHAGPQAGAAVVLKAHRFAGATGNLAPSPAEVTPTSFTLKGSFHSAEPGPGGNIFELATGLLLFGRSGDGPMGPLDNTRLGDSDPTPCFSARQSEDIVVDLADGAHLAQLPADLHLKSDHITYDSHWSVDGNSVSVHRAFVSSIDQPICSGAARREAAAALEKIRADYAAPTRLAAGTAP